jgi:TonB-dependent receptor
VIQRDIENNGQTFTVDVDGVGNASDSGEIQGFEVAYQQTFDELPGIWSGLGVQANYTYIDAQGIPNIGPKNDEPNGRGGAPNFDVSALGLPLMSEHTFNMVGFMETDQWSARLAYNWRSDYTLTVRDVIYPFTPIVHESTGQLDGAFFYNLTDGITVGVQGVNLLDEVSETSSVINDQLITAPRSYFRNDRRFAFIIRGRF